MVLFTINTTSFIFIFIYNFIMCACFGKIWSSSSLTNYKNANMKVHKSICQIDCDLNLTNSLNNILSAFIL